MATLKIPGLASPLPSVGNTTLGAPVIPLSYTMSSSIAGLNNTGAALPGSAISGLRAPLPAVTILQYPMTAIYPSNFTTGDSVGYPL